MPDFGKYNKWAQVCSVISMQNIQSMCTLYISAMPDVHCSGINILWLKVHVVFSLRDRVLAYAINNIIKNLFFAAKILCRLSITFTALYH